MHKIYIPTFRRVDSQITFNSLPDKYKANVIRVIDGDTLDVMIDLGFNTWVKKRVRLSGLDAYESRTRNKTEKKKKGLHLELSTTITDRNI